MAKIFDFNFDVARGNIDGISVIHKFGYIPSIASGSADIWAGGGFYKFYPKEEQALTIKSTSDLDKPSSTGAHEVTIKGLTGTNWIQTSETVTLNGTGVVSLKNKYYRTYRAFVKCAGSSDVNAGNITCQVGNTGTTAIHIRGGDGQTQQAIYTIPGDKTGHFTAAFLSITKAGKAGETAECQLKIKQNDINCNGAWQTKRQAGLNSIGTGFWEYTWPQPAGPLAGKTDIRLTIKEVSSDISVVGGFDILLVEA